MTRPLIIRQEEKYWYKIFLMPIMLFFLSFPLYILLQLDLLLLGLMLFATVIFIAWVFGIESSKYKKDLKTAIVIIDENRIVKKSDFKRENWTIDLLQINKINAFKYKDSYTLIFGNTFIAWFCLIGKYAYRDNDLFYESEKIIFFVSNFDEVMDKIKQINPNISVTIRNWTV